MRRGLVETRAEAARAVEQGTVLVNGAIADKVSRQVHPGDALVLQGPPPRFVSRGGDKLDAALDAFHVDVRGRHALDVGASTGGFTDCLLQRGAASVVAVDVGHGQLHPRLRADPRVLVLERFHARDLRPEAIGGRKEVIVADVSFISIVRLLPALLATAAPAAHLVLLVKPQFEAGRREAARARGVITDPVVHARVRAEVHEALEAAGCSVCGWITSPLRGADGNVEFLVHALVPRTGCGT